MEASWLSFSSTTSDLLLLALLLWMPPLLLLLGLMSVGVKTFTIGGKSEVKSGGGGVF